MKNKFKRMMSRVLAAALVLSMAVPWTAMTAAAEGEAGTADSRYEMDSADLVGEEVTDNTEVEEDTGDAIPPNMDEEVDEGTSDSGEEQPGNSDTEVPTPSDQEQEPGEPEEVSEPQMERAANSKGDFVITSKEQLKELFPDPIFRAAVFKAVKDGQDNAIGTDIKDALKNFWGSVTVKKKKTDPIESKITNIKGIELLRKANIINLTNNEIRDFSHLGQDVDPSNYKDYYGYTVSEFDELPEDIRDDREMGTNVYWILNGNPVEKLPENFGGHLVIDQLGKTSYTYPESDFAVVRPTGTKDISGELHIAKAVITDNGTERNVKLIAGTGSKKLPGDTFTLPTVADSWVKDNDTLEFIGLRKTGKTHIVAPVDKEVHYWTLDEVGTNTPGSQSFKYYLPIAFWVYDRVKVDTETSGSVTLTKTVKGDDETVVPGAVFSLYKKDGTLVAKDLSTDRNGQITKDGLANGAYYFQETQAPAGFVKDDKKIEFTIAVSDTAAAVTIEGGRKSITTASSETVTAGENEIFIAGANGLNGQSPDVVLKAAEGTVVKAVHVNYDSVDETVDSEKGQAISTTFDTLAEAQDDINFKKNHNLITGPISVQVETVAGEDDAVQVKATNKQDVVSITGTKTWVDIKGKEGSHPDVTLRLSQDGKPYPSKENQKTVVLKNGDSSYEFTDLPPNGPDGNKYVYTVSEDPVEGYTSQRTQTETGFDFKNTFVNEYTEVHGTKTWIDEDGFSGEHSPIKIYLTRNGDRTGEPKKLGGNSDKTESYKFEKLPVYSEDGKTKYTYGVEEVFVNSEDANKYKTPQVIGNNVINMFGDITTSVYVEKMWKDLGLADADHPELTFRLLQDGKQMKNDEGKDVIQTLKKDTKDTEVWFKDLPEYADNGKKYTYTVVEDPVQGYQSSRTAITKEGAAFAYQFTNTRLDGDTTSITAYKDWVDYEGWDWHNNPDVTIQLLQNGEEMAGMTKTISPEAGQSEVIFKDLPKMKTDGTEWKYSVKEIKVPGYTAHQVGNHITNVFESADKTQVKIVKTWISKAKENVPTVTFRLMQDGVPYKDSGTEVVFKMNAGTEEYTFENLPKYADNGKKHSYLVVEDPVAGYTSKSEVTSEETETSSVTTYSFTNTFINEYINLPFTKTWVDKEDVKAEELPSAVFELQQKLEEEGDDKWVTIVTKTLDHDKTEGQFEHCPLMWFLKIR